LVANDGDKCKVDDFRYCSLSGRTTNEKVDDKGFYDGIETSLPKFGFTDEERDQVWKMVSITLNTGNIKIDEDCYVEGSDPCALIQEENYKTVMTLSGMDNDKFGSEVVTSH